MIELSEATGEVWHGAVQTGRLALTRWLSTWSGPVRISGSTARMVDPITVPVMSHHPKIAPPADELDLSGVLVRTDYADDARFAQVLADARRQVGADSTHAARLLVVDDPRLAGIPPDHLTRLVEVDSFAFVADRQSMADGTLLVIDLYGDSETHLDTFRVAPQGVFMVETNLALANVDFSDFATLVDDDGVYRDATDWASS